MTKIMITVEIEEEPSESHPQIVRGLRRDIASSLTGLFDFGWKLDSFDFRDGIQNSIKVKIDYND